MPVYCRSALRMRVRTAKMRNALMAPNSKLKFAGAKNRGNLLVARRWEKRGPSIWRMDKKSRALKGFENESFRLLYTSLMKSMIRQSRALAKEWINDGESREEEERTHLHYERARVHNLYTERLWWNGDCFCLCISWETNKNPKTPKIFLRG